jgi:hypothetical protein
MPVNPRFNPRRKAPRAKRGVGAARAPRSGFWAGMVMGAATATGGFFAIKALERAFAKKDDPEVNPASSVAQQRLVAQATGAMSYSQPPPMLNPAPKPAVTKRTIIEEMVEDLDG